MQGRDFLPWVKELPKGLHKKQVWEGCCWTEVFVVRSIKIWFERYGYFRFDVNHSFTCELWPLQKTLSQRKSHSRYYTNMLLICDSGALYMKGYESTATKRMRTYQKCPIPSQIVLGSVFRQPGSQGEFNKLMTWSSLMRFRASRGWSRLSECR